MFWRNNYFIELPDCWPTWRAVGQFEGYSHNSRSYKLWIIGLVES